jgi:flavin-dependent dehydrogenase
VVSEDHPLSGIPENCSGLFSHSGLESLREFINYKNHLINPVYGADVFLSGVKLSIRRKNPVAFVCDRAAFDAELAQKAEAEGAKINFGERVTGSFHAENIIGADGPHSFVARHFAFPKISKFALTLQAKLGYRCADPHTVEVHISNDRFPGFFAWIIPQDEYTAEFGVGVESPKRAIDAWNALLKMKGIVDAPKPSGFAIPLSTRQKSAGRMGGKNVLLVGDAAGQVKSTTGGGVIFGGNCARLAGRFATDPSRYELEWRARFGADLLAHSLVHNYLAGLPDRGLEALGRRLKKLNFDAYLSNHGHMDRPTLMLRPQLISHLFRNFMGGT